MDDQAHLRRAIALAHAARSHGNHPFGAILVVDGAVVCEAENTVITGGDRTQHAEMNLLRIAEQTLDLERLRRATLYASTEPCAMCAGAIYWTGVVRVVFGCPAAELGAMTDGSLVIPCRDVFARGTRRVDTEGPLLLAEALAPHRGFWGSRS